MRNRTHWTLNLVTIAAMAVVPAGAALGQAEQLPAQEERQQEERQQGQQQESRQAEDQEQRDRQAEDQQQAEGQQQEAVTGISMEGTLRAVDTEQMTLLVAVDPASIMASEGESLANVPELNRGAEGEAEAGREPQQADQQRAGQEVDQQEADQQRADQQQAEAEQQGQAQQTAEAEADAPLLLFHYDDQTEVFGDIQRIEGLSEQPNAQVRIDYRAEGNRAIAERIEVLGNPQEAQPEGREAEDQDEEPGNLPDF